MKKLPMAFIFKSETVFSPTNPKKKIPKILPRTKFWENLNDYQFGSVSARQIWNENRSKRGWLIRFRKKDGGVFGLHFEAKKIEKLLRGQFKIFFLWLRQPHEEMNESFYFVEKIL